ncbi:MAG: hypothetical protein MUO77_07230, partial [Anaerolineales bacterium]|nr:hypothetical protein [Anaerolineales bacterium]
LKISSASIDRCLRPVRIKSQHGLSTTKPGSLLKNLIPVRTFTEWNYLPVYAGHGRKAKYGTLVRPLPCIHNGQPLTATAPGETIVWQENDCEIRAEIWRGLILNKIIPDKENKTFDVYAIYDPNFDEPWLLATPVELRASSVYPS